MKFVPSWLQQLGQSAQGLPTLQGLPGSNTDPRTLADVLSEMYSAQDDLATADQFSNARYIDNSGLAGGLLMGLQGFVGKKMRDQSQGKLSDLLREKSDLMSRAEREELEREAARAQAEFDRKVAAARKAQGGDSAEAIALGLKIPKGPDPFQQYLESLPPEQRNQAYAVKAGLAPRPGSGTSVNIAAPMGELEAAVAAGDITPEEARRIRREKLGAELPLKDQMAADADAANQAARAETRAGNADSVLQEIRAAKEAVGPLTAGAGGAVLSRVPGTSARDLQARLQTVTANLSFDRLQQMREESKTGGALGGIAVKELDLLGSALVSLDQAQSPQQLAAALDKAEKHYARYLDLRSQFQGSKPGEIIPNSQAGGKSLEELLGQY